MVQLKLIENVSNFELIDIVLELWRYLVVALFKKVMAVWKVCNSF